MSLDDKTLAKIHSDLKSIKRKLPNGEMKRMEVTMLDMAAKLGELHHKIMDPEAGLIVQTKKNTEFRETCSPEREVLIAQFQGMLRWKKAVEWGVGVVFVAVIGSLVKYLTS